MREYIVLPIASLTGMFDGIHSSLSMADLISMFTSSGDMATFFLGNKLSLHGMLVGVLLGAGGFGTHLSFGGGGSGGGVTVENGHGGKRTVVSFRILMLKQVGKHGRCHVLDVWSLWYLVGI